MNNDCYLDLAAECARRLKYIPIKWDTEETMKDTLTEQKKLGIQQTLATAVSYLPYKKRSVMRLLYGIVERKHTHKQVAKIFNITRKFAGFKARSLERIFGSRKCRAFSEHKIQRILLFQKSAPEYEERKATSFSPWIATSGGFLLHVNILMDSKQKH